MCPSPRAPCPTNCYLMGCLSECRTQRHAPAPMCSPPSCLCSVSSPAPTSPSAYPLNTCPRLLASCLTVCRVMGSSVPYGWFNVRTHKHTHTHIRIWLRRDVICACVSFNARTHTHTHTHTYIWCRDVVCARVSLHTLTGTYARTHTHTHTHICLRRDNYVSCVFMRSHTQLHACARTHKHIHTRIRLRRDNSMLCPFMWPDAHAHTRACAHTHTSTRTCTSGCAQM